MLSASGTNKSCAVRATSEGNVFSGMGKCTGSYSNGTGSLQVEVQGSESYSVAALVARTYFSGFPILTK